MGQNQSTPCMKAFYTAYNTGATDDSCNPAVLNAPVLGVGEFSGQLRAVFGGGVFGSGGVSGGYDGGVSCGVSGGSISGGYDALQDYGDSLFSKSKEKLINLANVYLKFLFDNNIPLHKFDVLREYEKHNIDITRLSTNCFS